MVVPQDRAQAQRLGTRGTGPRHRQRALKHGIGLDGLTKIATDDNLRMRSDLLAEAVEADLAAGVRPLAVVATVGTTSTTSIDPVPEIAAVCSARAVWLHVDAAYGGFAALTTRGAVALDASSGPTL